MCSYMLAEGVYFISGAARGAIYDTNTGNVFSLNSSACDIVAGKEETDSFWSTLAGKSLATPAVTTDELTRQLPKCVFTLDFMALEITTDACNQFCLHCYADSKPKINRKSADIRQFNIMEKLHYHDWQHVIEEGYTLGCRRIQFIGGEPFMYQSENGETVLDLVEYARTSGYKEIEIFTNGTLVTAQDVLLIRQLGVNVAISLYSADSRIHDMVTRVPGSWQKTVATLKALRSLEVPTRVEMIIMRINQHDIDETLKFIEDLGLQHKAPDILRPRGRGNNPALQPDAPTVARWGLQAKPDFKADPALLARCHTGHSCLAGKVAITDHGDVLPCIFSRNQVAGNITGPGSFSKIVTDSSLQKIWHTNKDSILVCKDCEYRYVCCDCRPLAEAENGGNYFTAPYPRCTYNPYLGEWGNGVWRLDGNGEPIYDNL